MTTHNRLEHFERRTEWPLAAIAIAFLGLYSVQVLAQPQGEPARVVDAALRGLYFVFVIDYGARLYLVEPRVKLREEILRLSNLVTRDREPAYGEAREGL